MLEEIIITVVILMVAIILHECAHGWTALKLGDPTAKEQGRLTLNPLKHIDPFGTVILPGSLLLLKLVAHMDIFVFGWAKPVPVNFRRLRQPRRDMMLVALAGPAINVFSAFIFSLILKNFQLQLPLKYFDFILFAIFINLLLAVFNMIPVPPLDGSRIVMGLLPKELAVPYSQLEPYGILIVLFCSYMGLFSWFVVPIVHALGLLLGVNL